MKKFFGAVLMVLYIFVNTFTVNISAEGSVLQYGYIAAVAYDEDAVTGEEALFVQVYDSFGLENIYQCAAGVVVNGTTYESLALAEQAIESETYGEFVLNDQGEITKINCSKNFPADKQVNATIDFVVYNDGQLEVYPKFNYILKDCTAMLAVYNRDGRMLGVSQTEVTTSNYDECVLTLSATKDYVGLTAKVFFWQYGETVAPVGNAVPKRIVAAEGDVQYGYIGAVAYDIDDVTLEDKMFIQVLSDDGVEALEFKNNGVILGDETLLGDGTVDVGAIAEDTEKSEAVAEYLDGKVIQFAKNYEGKISRIITSDYASAEFALTYENVENAQFDMKTNSFSADTSSVAADEASTVFFVLEDEFERSSVGKILDIEHGIWCNLIGVYADGNAVDNNIFVVDAASLSEISSEMGLAVVTAVYTTENEDAETVGVIELLVRGDEVGAETTTDVWTEVNDVLTIGDLVKVNVNDYGKIDKLAMVWDADETIRIFKTDSAENLADLAPLYERGDAEAGLNETFVGGKVVNCYNNKIYFSEADDAVAYRLPQASYIYVIDDSGRNVEIKKGTTSSFKVYEVLYDGEAGRVTLSDGTIFENVADADAQQAADYVYLRTYNDKVVDVVIVKGTARFK